MLQGRPAGAGFDDGDGRPAAGRFVPLARAVGEIELHLLGSAAAKHRVGTMWQAYHKAVLTVNHFGMQEWFFVLVGVVIFGAFCMRGFGSRSGY